MVDTRPLLKGFGAAVDVVGQIATDRAINSRRTRSGTFDISKGVLWNDAIEATTKWYPHSLGRKPVGAIKMLDVPGLDINVIGVRADAIRIISNGAAAPGALLLWVV